MGPASTCLLLYPSLRTVITVYDFKYFQALPFGLFEFQDLSPDYVLSQTSTAVVLS